MATKAKVLQQLEKIPGDEPLFLLRGQDRAAPAAICEWCNAADELGAPETKTDEAYECRRTMIEWQKQNPARVKVPD